MKRLLLFIYLSLTLCLAADRSNAQAHLVIQSLINYPDTAYQGLSITPVIVIRNIGISPFTGIIRVGLRVDSSYQYLYSSGNNPTTIFPNAVDTLNSPAGTATYVFDSSVYRVGNNVVVVWPVVSQAIVDTLHTNVYFLPQIPTGSHENHGIRGLRAHPNPAMNFIQLYSPEKDLEHVRVLDIAGRTLYNSGIPEDAKIPIEFLPPGLYFLEVTGKENSLSVLRFIKVNN